MSVNATYGKCDEKLLNDMLEVENGSVQISIFPNGHRKIKSPLCCGQDMICTLQNFKFSHNRIFGFLFFGIIIISIIVIVVNFINKNHNKTIIKEKNPTDNKIKKELNKLKKLYEDGLITKRFQKKNKRKF